jgi:3-oxoacyl-(acyl-carrier-protein) synthase
MRSGLISVNGIGWITGSEYGRVGRGSRAHYRDRTELRKELFSYPFKGFGKLDDISVMLCCAVALALKDAGIAYNADRKQQTGIIGTNSSGCRQSDINYFRDYLDSGRIMARGNLFIYTLSSSPLGEASIHFGLQGPLIYAADPVGSLSKALEIAADMINIDGLPVMLAGSAEEDEAIFFVLEKEGYSEIKGSAVCSLDKAMAITNRDYQI